MKTITKQQWEKKHDDYKSIIDGKFYVLELTDAGSCLRQVLIEN